MIVRSPLNSSGATDLRLAHLWSSGTTTWNGSSYRNSVVTPGGANGSAMIAASMRPHLSAASRCSVRFSSMSSGICGAQIVQRRNEVGQQVRCDRVDDAQLQRAEQLVAPGLRDLPDPRRLLEHLLRLLDDAPADRRDRDLALAALEQAGAELLLELLDRHRQRRLAHEAVLRCPAEALLLGDRDQVAKLVERHASEPPRCPRSRRKAAKSVASSGCLRPKSTVASR